MNSTAAIEAEIALLAHDPACQMEARHGDERPRADYWLDKHGCCEYLMCAQCLVWYRHVYDGWVVQGLVLHCNDCGKDFPTFDAVCKVVPLR
ncbi:hypothetical protein [Nocardia asiatica]|uniref:hypothetical protein n=1 Tax=Nocardia asiatica TaxID=209252 RepID=UPI002457865E|nr:hypothetical protein [Nocardia asiatica]